MRLSQDTMSRLPSEVGKPAYDRAQRRGIVHFGIGAFHRAHQAQYTDDCLGEGDTDWMIVGVSLRSGSVSLQLNPQDGLYTVTERSASGDKTRAIGSVAEVLVASDDHAAIVDRIAAPECRIVSFTITEKGYCRALDGSLDFPNASEGFYPILTEALARRREQNLSGLTLLSCDNLSGNGKVLGQLIAEWLSKDPALADWFVSNCTTPDTMIDRIVPSTTPADIDALERRIGVRDEGAVFTEPFSQWVIEDRFAGERPRWERVGAELVDDVMPYEIAKLRMLNGAHSALAYIGLLRGYSYVHEAVADGEVRRIVERLIKDEAATSFQPAAGQDLMSYADALIARFENPALHHRLIQIAMDGSQKLPQRWLETLAAHQREGRSCPSILWGLAAWISHLQGENEAQWGEVEDPLRGQLREILDRATPEEAVYRIFGKDGILASAWVPSTSDVRTICRN